MCAYSFTCIGAAWRTISQGPGESVAVALARQGVLGGTPFFPSRAFSLPLLEFYHRLRRRQPGVGIQGFAKTLCAFHNIPYVSTIQDNLSGAFDIYLSILKDLKQREDDVLGCDRRWYIKYGCPCCGFEQPDDTKLVPARMHAMDGNNSQKRLRGAGRSTMERTFNSDYFLARDQVDRFTNEVHSKSTDAADKTTTRRGKTKIPCTDNWTTSNAGATGKSVTEVFAQTGLFVCICRHGLCEYAVEMYQSGELAKYFLAVLNEIMDNLGQDQSVGYDIGCSANGTVDRSSLGERAAATNLQVHVNAFHGYQHNRLCQLLYHPLLLPGVGMEDFEGCERMFSSSNRVAALVRHASYYHWMQFIDLHLQQQDEDRYSELSNFVYNNYRSAVKLLKEYTVELEAFSRVTGFSAADFEHWQEEEVAYLVSLKSEPQYDVLRVDYVQALQDLDAATIVHEQLLSAFEVVTYDQSSFSQGSTSSAKRTPKMRAAQAERASAARKLNIAVRVADSTERALGIAERWTKASPEYIETVEYIHRRTFIRAVEELQGLVVQRLLELTKANLSKTGYKLRKHIAAAITKCSAAVCASMERYNQLAPKQSPPRPRLDYKQVCDMVWLGEFDLLKESRQEILSKDWAILKNREMATKYFKTLRAKEELVRCNVEASRLQAWIDHEDRELITKASELQGIDPRMSVHFQRLASQRRILNDRHRSRLQKLYKMPEYTGPRPSVDNMDTTDVADDAEEKVDAHDDEALNDELVRAGELLDGLTLV
ncbi:hypothetical protein OF83DRAFT_1070468 [Amylostereum chailletii]|nr:hypothetical protein OF83DRAFT_1070468 [Amylostereum chailletii]